MAEELTYMTAAEETALGWRGSTAAKNGYFLAGVVLPTIWLALMGSGITISNSTWKLNKICDLTRILLTYEASLPLYIFHIYSMTCMLFIIRNPEKYSKRFVVRFGVYTGVILAFQNLLFTEILLFEDDIVVALLFHPVFAIAIWLDCRSLINLKNSKKPQSTSTIKTVVSCITSGLGAIIMGFFLLPCVFPFMIAICTPAWALIAYVSMALYLFRQNARRRWQFNLSQLFACVTWLAAFCGAWRISVSIVMTKYADRFSLFAF